MGQGVDDARGMFGTTLGLHSEFGAERSFDVPLAEDAMTGIGIGAALMGMRPIQVHQRMDFVLLCMNQLVNMAAKMSYMFAGAHQACRWSCARSSGEAGDRAASTARPSIPTSCTSPGCAWSRRPRRTTPRAA